MDTLLQSAFWDVSFETLSWDEHRDFIIRRILQVGSFQMIHWLSSHLDDAELRDWLIKNRGGGLSPRQLSYWETILDIPETFVNQWISASASNPWRQRLWTPAG
jgi:hypothetical protein